ncbi:MAG: tRNA (N6-threonylcarbamoyladenosine(37)-N6)-methyltransferase TrmO [Chloroflexi bacterium RBG_13_54_8]|nr:MAG: tRNA (N6-threonylcarbamoyladenosine(37)-N6)-methyltransferase TrmO [Chloroflexi bacterium RBG_13_54_8]
MPEGADSNSEMILTAIGHVKNDINGPMRDGWDAVVSEIVLRADLEEATEGLEQFSHIVVAFWMHRVPQGESVTAKVHPRGRQDLPLVGLFATRAPSRPNPIGISEVALMERCQNVLRVKGLDTVNGTPIVDIKPYLPGEHIGGATFPEWVMRL